MSAPAFSFPDQVRITNASDSPAFTGAHEVVQIASLRAAAELALQRNGQAYGDTGIALRVSESLDDEPLVISDLVEIATFAIAMRPVWDGLTRHAWSDAQLVEFDSRLRKFNFGKRYAQCARAEVRMSIIPAIDTAEVDPSGLLTLIQMSSPEQKLSANLIRVMPPGWFLQNKASLCRIFDRAQTIIDRDSGRFSVARVTEIANAITKTERSFLHPYSYFAFLAEPGIHSFAKTSAVAQGIVDLARVAIALERHRLKHTEYPLTFETLDSSCRPNGIPADCITGHPPHYQRGEDGGFNLYYEGWNEKDDGGTVVLKADGKADPEQGDWVWPKLVSP